MQSCLFLSASGHQSKREQFTAPLQRIHRAHCLDWAAFPVFSDSCGSLGLYLSVGAVPSQPAAAKPDGREAARGVRRWKGTTAAEHAEVSGTVRPRSPGLGSTGLAGNCLCQTVVLTAESNYVLKGVGNGNPCCSVALVDQWKGI